MESTFIYPRILETLLLPWHNSETRIQFYVASIFQCQRSGRAAGFRPINGFWIHIFVLCWKLLKKLNRTHFTTYLTTLIILPRHRANTIFLIIKIEAIVDVEIQSSDFQQVITLYHASNLMTSERNEPLWCFSTEKPLISQQSTVSDRAQQ